jgi:hypothetical protein
MQSKRIWNIQSLISCLILNTILLVPLFVMATQVLAALRQWVSPFLAPGNSGLSAEMQSAFVGLSQLMGETQQYLASVIFGLGLLVTLALWLILQYQSRRLLMHTEPQAISTASAGSMSTAPIARPPDEIPRAVPQPPQPYLQTAVQMLAILQREGRLVDFLKEDLRSYTDDQIGAAVRSIHQGCRAALDEHVELRPIVEDVEGAEVTVPPDFDPKAIRLTGNVSGDPPFRGTLRHHGWRVLSLDLPQVRAPREKDWILTPAEVEIAD